MSREREKAVGGRVGERDERRERGNRERKKMLKGPTVGFAWETHFKLLNWTFYMLCFNVDLNDCFHTSKSLF